MRYSDFTPRTNSGPIPSRKEKSYACVLSNVARRYCYRGYVHGERSSQCGGRAAFREFGSGSR